MQQRPPQQRAQETSPPATDTAADPADAPAADGVQDASSAQTPGAAGAAADGAAGGKQTRDVSALFGAGVRFGAGRRGREQPRGMWVQPQAQPAAVPVAAASAEPAPPSPAATHAGQDDHVPAAPPAAGAAAGVPDRSHMSRGPRRGGWQQRDARMAAALSAQYGWPYVQQYMYDPAYASAMAAQQGLAPADALPYMYGWCVIRSPVCWQIHCSPTRAGAPRPGTLPLVAAASTLWQTCLAAWPPRRSARTRSRSTCSQRPYADLLSLLSRIWVAHMERRLCLRWQAMAGGLYAPQSPGAAGAPQGRMRRERDPAAPPPAPRPENTGE
jgi:hypothetical protein